MIRTFAEQARTGTDITVDGDGKQTRDFVHVSDIVRANLRAATTDAVGEAFNIGTGNAISIRELAELIRDLSDSNSDIVHREPRLGDIDVSEADISKARTKLGFSPTMDLERALVDLEERI